MPPPLHLSDINFNCIPYQRFHGKQTGTMTERTNEGVYVSCRKILYNSLMNVKIFL